MKRSILVLLTGILACATVFAQPKQDVLKITYPKFVLGFYCQPQNGDATVLPLLEGRASAGSKERFGILLQKLPVSTSLIDILDVSGKILKSVTVGDFTGKNPTSGIKLVGAKSQAQQQRAEILHEISLPAGRIILSTKILATGTGKTQGNPVQLFISFCVTSVTAQNLALNVNLPLEGTVEGKANGAVVSAKNSPASIGISIVGKSEKIEVVKNVLVAKSAVTAVSKETPVLWLVVDGSTNAAAAAAKNEVSASMEKMTNSASEPLLSIVNTLDKENAQPADTITYTLFCKNVGGAQATDVVVSNPIPAGARFLENSATGEKTDITIVRTATAAPQLGEVKEVRWKFLEPLGAGCEKIVTFKVVIL